MSDGYVEFIIGLLIGAIVSGALCGAVSKELMQERAVEAGVAEFYINSEYEKQFKYKEIDK